MKKTAQLALLEAALRKEGYRLRYEKGNFLGGDCRLREDRVVVVNKFLPIEGKLITLAKVIGKINPPGLSPDVGAVIDKMLNSGLFGRNKA
ncbi:hypothetical protein [Pelodictyon luteolum]|uniref:Uncharacterized protein n=1 Tax=Chlorobium luteolum (strain DSM 273 / BCRC 81028 / 2530) TaxID=319225 RepID=Q3B377_CHLL3|nr:hypothetical protein [Pelodictyon luteolum]ABB24204.1 conserved hypothetical protein [Pelodictyon luteolum DSM 273]